MKYLFNNIVINCILILFVAFPNLEGQDEWMMTPKKMKKDLKEIEDLIGGHADPYRHYSEEEFAGFIKEAYTAVSQPLSKREFFKTAAELVAKIKDGHTSVRLPVELLRAKLKANGVFPFELFINDENEFYVIQSYEDGESSIPLGAKILKINGKSTEEIISELDGYVSYERIPFRNFIIQSRISEYLYLTFGDIKQYGIEYSYGKTTAIIVNTIPLSQRKRKMKDFRDEGDRKKDRGIPYEYEKLEDEVGLLALNSFGSRDMKSFAVFLEKSFRKISKEGINYLIIDVRGNLGGWPKLSADIFHYLTDKNFKTIALSQTKVTEPYQYYFKKRGLRNYEGNARKLLHHVDLHKVMSEPVGSILTEVDYYNEAPQTKSHEYTGRIFLLTDRRSYSASSCFAATFKCYGLGSIIGEETGGTAIFHANSFSRQLFHSGFVVSIAPSKKYTACYDQPDNGIKPDIDVKPSILDRVNQVDSPLNYTRMMIRKLKLANARKLEEEEK